MTPDDALDLVEDELHRARSRFPGFRSPHEGFAIIFEEFDELKVEVWNRDLNAMRTEAKQLAAMATRFLIDCT